METVVERKKNTKAALAAGGRAQLEKLFRKRMPAYRQTDITRGTDGDDRSIDRPRPRHDRAAAEARRRAPGAGWNDRAAILNHPGAAEPV
jgi:hypothetical protein